MDESEPCPDRIGMVESGMRKKITALSVFLLICLSIVALGMYYYPQLPETVACHFGSSGQADGWLPKATFFKGFYLFIAFLVVLFPGIAVSLSKMPVSLINLPNKDYWMAPERKRKTLDFMFSYLLWIGSATLLLILDLLAQTIRVHLGNEETLTHIWPSIGLYTAFVILWIIGLYRKFGKTGTEG